MRILLLVCLLVGMIFTASSHGSEELRPGWMRRTLRVFGLGKRDQAGENPGVARTKNLTLTMVVTPEKLDLSETRQLKIALSLVNRSRRAVQLDFPTTQRIEVLIKEQSGKLVTQWSEDQAFENQPVFVTINPGERIEYSASIGTRDLVAGKTYTVESFFPNFDPLKATKTITPVK